VVLVESLHDCGGASVMEPWERLVRDRALMGVVGEAVGGAAGGGASGWLTWAGGLFGIPGRMDVDRVSWHG
jgi:hypothetical protein